MNGLAVTLILIGAAALFFVVEDRYLAPRRARKAVAKLLKNKDKIDPRVLEDPKHGSLLCDDDVLKVATQKKEQFELRWDEVEEVHAFKRDLFTVDLICLAFKRTSKDEYLEVHEEMCGYYDMQKKLPDRLPGFSEAWFADVAFPAFATNHHVIWKRKTEPNQSLQPTAPSDRG